MALEIRVDPSSITEAVAAAGPGDILLLDPGVYTRPLLLKRIRGRADAPVVLRGQPGVVLDGGQSFESFNPIAVELSRDLVEDGAYPGVYPIADQGFVRIIDCDWLRLENLTFRGCWPTAIAILSSRNVALTGHDIVGGSFAIHASGRSTAGLDIGHCTWVQDPSPDRRLWRELGWERVHRAHPVLDSDARAYDGDFFRAIAIAGDVSIHDNVIENAFNAIHLYNVSLERPDPDLNNNVRIFRNRFRYIRDNAIEPEYGGYNWWIHHNSFYNVHKWLSLELRRSGQFYIFGNTGWFDEQPGPPDDNHRGGAVFKLLAEPEDTGLGHYIFHNSWYLRSGYAKRHRARNLLHFNNAIEYCGPDAPAGAGCTWPKSLFGYSLREAPSAICDERDRFTISWAELNVRMVGDIVWHPHVPDILHRWHYPVEGWRQARPGFRDPAHGDFRLADGAAARGTAIAQTVLLPNGSEWQIPAGGDVGAWQGDQLILIPERG